MGLGVKSIWGHIGVSGLGKRLGKIYSLRSKMVGFGFMLEAKHPRSRLRATRFRASG